MKRPRKVEVLPYSGSWPLLYRQEAKKLYQVIGPSLHSVHHIGSTAIFHGHAKPIIDIMLLFKTIERVDQSTAAIESLGYKARGEYGISGRRYFQKGEDPRLFQLHCFALDNPNVVGHLLFRDYMNNYPEEVKKYSKLKQELAQKYPTDIDSYVKYKSVYVTEVFKKIASDPIAKNYEPLKDIIELTPYDINWANKAQNEIKAIQSIDRTKVIIDIQHIGSTSIKGLSAKPILDIMIGVKPIEKGQMLIEPLEKMNYQFWCDNPDKTRMFFVKGMPPKGKKRTHHIHIVEHNSPRWQMRLLFRDYLNTHLEVAQSYKNLKEELSKFYKYDREAYTHAKSSFVSEVLEKAGYQSKVFR